MAFNLIRPAPLRLFGSQASRPVQALLRPFHSASKPALFTGAPVRQSIFASQRPIFRNAFKRTYIEHPYQPVRAEPGLLRQRLLYGAGIFGATLVTANLLFNRETRDDGGMPPYERAYLNETFLHTGLGLGMIAVTARALHMNGWTVRLMSANPWLVLGLSLVGSIGTMYATMKTAPENYVQKYALWTGFNVAQACILTPLLLLQPALLARAGLYTVGMMGSIAFVGATAKQEKYLYLGGPLLAGCTVLLLSGLVPLVAPVTAVRTLLWSERLWLYGGLAVFGGFTLYDVQKVLQHARLAERGLVARDAVNESIALELDFLNIFIRMAWILSGQNRKR